MYIETFFNLKDEYVDGIFELVPKFGYNGYGEIVYYRTYSRKKPKDSTETNPDDYTGQETWHDTVLRVVNGVFSIRKDHYRRNRIPWNEERWQDYAFNFAKSMFKMEWVPPGRGLWAMGTQFVVERGSMALYNCFSGDTKFLNSYKMVALKDCVDSPVTVLTKQGFKPATVKCFGKQKLVTLIFKPVIYKTKHRLEYNVTRNHRWIKSNGDVTDFIQIGNRINVSKVLTFDRFSEDYLRGKNHGLIFADGSQNTYYPTRFQIRLCGDKNKFLQQLENDPRHNTTCSPETYNGDNFVTLLSEPNLKQIPKDETSLEYKLGFFEGWLDGDGTFAEVSRKLDTTSVEGVEWIKEWSAIFGYVITGHSIINNVTNYGERNYPLHRLSFQQNSIEFELQAILDKGHEEDVYCVVEPETKSFTLEGGVITGNCAFTNLTNSNLAEDLEWLMDSLMMGVGVGWQPVYDETLICNFPVGTYIYEIGDTRESWAHSVKLLVDCYLGSHQKRKPVFDYSQIRRKGLPIRGFGGLASGPEPLMKLHKQIEGCFNRYIQDLTRYNDILLKADLANLIGCCVVAGNVRRSAEIGLGSIKNQTFRDLKDYEKYPYREAHGWMSNNTVLCEEDEDYMLLGEVAKSVTVRGEPGIANLKNFKKGRLNGKNETRRDNARGANPCGEIQLEHRETCNVVETCPTICETEERWIKACEYATFYASTVSLLPTHQPTTNSVVMRNRRIGVGIIDYTGWIKEKGMHNVIRSLRRGYKVVRETNQACNSEAGVPESIKVTTIKPGGTVPKLVGKTSGAGYPTSQYTLRRTRIAANHPMVALLRNAGVPIEPEKFDPDNTLVFEFPIKQGPSKPAEEATLWEQAMNIVTLQREWADNSVSNTLYFKPKWVLIRHEFGDEAVDLYDIYKDWNTSQFKITTVRDDNEQITEIKIYEFNPHHEEDDIEPVMSAIVPLTKMISFLPHSAKGVYAQMPEEEICYEEYVDRINAIDEIDWSQYFGSDGQDEKYCTGDTCQIP